MAHRRGNELDVVCEPLEARTLLAATAKLNIDDVNGLLARAASQAMNRQAVVVSDREGVILGIFTLGNATQLTISKAVARARTAAFFQSHDGAFTTRTARFIIQDHFPHPVPNTPGGPLYGVEFSSLPGSDTLSGSGLSGDPGGIPLYKSGQPVGGIGVAGDGNDLAARSDFRGIPNVDVDNPTNGFYNGVEESDFDEKVALAGARGYMAPNLIRANQIFLDGLRLPFTKDTPATARPEQTLDALISGGAGALKRAPALGKTTASVIPSPAAPYPTATFGGISGELKNPNPAAPNFGIISSNDTKNGVVRPGAERLTYKDVAAIITDAVNQALITARWDPPARRHVRARPHCRGRSRRRCPGRFPHG